MVFTACSLVAPAFVGAQPAPAGAQPKQTRVDQHGDPLPEGAVARIGTTRFRHGGMDLVGFTSDGKALIYLGGGALHFMDAALGKETKVLRYGDSEPRGMRRFDTAFSAVLSGDTKVLAAASSGAFGGFGPGGSSISVIDTATGKERKQFGAADLFKNGGQFSQLALALTDDGKWLLVSSGDRERRKDGGGPPLVWVDTTSGQPVHEFAPEKDCRFGHAQFSRDGRHIVVLEHSDGKGNTRLRTIDAARGTEVRSVEVPPNSGIVHFELLPDGKSLLATGGQGGPLRLYDLTADKELKEVRAFSDPSPPRSFVLSRDGKQLFIASGAKVHHWDVDGGKEIRQSEIPDTKKDDGRFGGPNGLMETRSLALSLDGKQLAFSGVHNALVLDTQTGKPRGGGGEGGAIGTVRFTPDGKGLVVSNSDQAVQMWDVPAAKLRRVFARFDKEAQPRLPGGNFFGMFVGHSAFSADGKLLAVGMEQGTGLWDATSGATLKRYGPDADKEKDLGFQDPIPHAFAFAPRGNLLATSMPNGAIKLWDAATGQGLRSWSWHTSAGGPAGRPGPDAAVLALAFSPDGKTLAGGAVYDMGQGIPRSALILWETATGKERMRLGSVMKGLGNNDFELEMIFRVLDQMALSVLFSPDGKYLMVGTFNGFHLVDALTGKDVVSYSGRMLLGRTATFSTDGKLLFVGRVDGSLRVLDAATGRVLRDIPAHAEPLLALALSPDGKLLASGSNDSTVLLWNVAELSKPAAVGKALVTAKELEEQWNDLANDDAAKAYQAMNGLAAAPAEGVLFLKSRLKAITPMDPKVLENLLDDLNSPKFQVREKATVQLEKLGDLAGPILKERLAAQPALEMRQRIERLAAKLNAAVQSPQTLQALRAIEVLERIGTREAFDVLAPLAKGAPGHRITEDARDAVQRLERQVKAP